MKTTMQSMLRRTMAGLCAAMLAGAAQAALQDRDLDGDSVVDAFYDTDLDVTWLRDTKVIDNGWPSGYISWTDALAWANGLSFAGYTDWRLPKGNVACSTYDCVSSEMGHLWYTELGNSAGAMTNPGGFIWDFYSTGATYYWTSTLYDPGHAQIFEITAGYVGARVTWSTDFAMAVRDGDVPSIPEPGTCALMLAGVGGLAVVARRRQR